MLRQLFECWFFNKDGSVSSICSDGKFIADNLPAVGRKWNGVMHTYYPTRSVFNFSDKNCSVGWVYQQNQKRYIYQLPSFNDILHILNQNLQKNTRRNLLRGIQKMQLGEDRFW